MEEFVSYKFKPFPSSQFANQSNIWSCFCCLFLHVQLPVCCRLSPDVSQRPWVLSDTLHQVATKFLQRVAGGQLKYRKGGKEMGTEIPLPILLNAFFSGGHFIAV